MTEEEDDPVYQTTKNGFMQLQVLQGLHQNLGLWPSDGASMSFDHEEGTLAFTEVRTQREVVARVQIVGTIDGADGSWLWAWANPWVPEPLKQTANHVRAFGERHRNADLTTALFPCTYGRAWELTALAFYLAEGFDAYSLPRDGDWTFVILLELPRPRAGQHRRHGARDRSGSARRPRERRK